MNRSTTIRRSTPRRNRRRGLVLVLMAVLLVVFVGLCALTVDLGYLCVAQAELQRTADAAALAAVSVMQDQSDLNASPNPPAVAYAARNAACKYAGLNPCGPYSANSTTFSLARNDANSPEGDLVLGHFNSATATFDPSSVRYNAAYVRARRDAQRNGPLPLFFAPIFGHNTAGVSKDAAAYVETDVAGFRIPPGNTGTAKLLPFSLQIDLWAARASNGIDHFTHNSSTQTVAYGPDGVFEINLYPSQLGPGNFGTVDIGSSNNSTSDLSRQILHGPNASDLAYFPNNTVQLDENGILVLNGDTGISAAIKDELNAIVGQPRILPLHAMMWGNGNNASFQIVAFVGVTILDAKLTGALKKKYVKIQPCYATDGTAVGGGADGTTSRFIMTPPRLRKTS